MLDLGDFEAGQTAVVFGRRLHRPHARPVAAHPRRAAIIVTDVVDANLEAARALGAHVTLNPTRDDVAAEVLRLTGAGVDLALEAAGSPAALAPDDRGDAARAARSCWAATSRPTRACR